MKANAVVCIPTSEVWAEQGTKKGEGGDSELLKLYPRPRRLAPKLLRWSKGLNTNNPGATRGIQAICVRP
jgi:hypothetical protein